MNWWRRRKAIRRYRELRDREDWLYLQSARAWDRYDWQRGLYYDELREKERKEMDAINASLNAHDAGKKRGRGE